MGQAGIGKSSRWRLVELSEPAISTALSSNELRPFAFALHIDALAHQWSYARLFQVSHAAVHGVKREAGSSLW